MTMRNFILWDGAAEVAAVQVSHETMLPTPADGQGWHEIIGPVDGTTLRLVGHELVEVRRELPVDDALSLARSTRWAAAKAFREAHAAGGCMTPLGRVDTDDASRQKISGAVQMAMIALSAGEPFSIEWTMSDNSIVAHDAPAMIAMGVAVGRFIDACQRASVAIRAVIATADDPATVDILVGYPA